MRRAIRHGAVCAVLAAGAIVAPASGPEPETAPPETARRLSAELSLGTVSGEYGSEASTDLRSLAARLRWSSSRFELRLSLPYLRLESAEPTRLVGGQPVGPSLGNGSPPRPGGGPAGLVAPQRTVRTGIGDAKLRADYFLLAGGPSRPWIGALAEIKLPTADADAGLGTGEADLSAGLSWIQPLGRTSLLAEASYTHVGDPAGTDYDDVVGVGAGVAHGFGGEVRASVWAYVERRTHPVRGLDDRSDLLVGGGIRLGRDRRTRLSAGVLAGLSETAGDLGIVLGVGRSF